ncbi:MAG TPA: hypothetical protein HPP94_09820 [Desulfuromonadales bacterium]|nr:hypothetical protein [Desulfuromonadales bacterium]
MKFKLISSLLLVMLILSGCGGGEVTVTVTQPTFIQSDALLDGDIEVASNSTIVTQGISRSVFVGIDPLTLTETRAFLDFPLAGILTSANIYSAHLDIVIDSLSPGLATVPILIDLVSYPQPLLAADFSSAFFKSTTIAPPITVADVGQHVTVDVTALMQEAQVRGLSHFQLRLLSGSGGTATGLVEINDSTGVNRTTDAPQLTVVYY